MRLVKGFTPGALVLSIAALSGAYGATAPAGGTAQPARKALAPRTVAQKARQKEQLGAAYSRLPLQFEANAGQANQKVKFLARGSGYGLYLTATEAVLALHRDRARTPFETGREIQKTPAQTSVLRMKLVGSNPGAPVTGAEELQSKSNYIKGSDPRQWRTDVANFAKVRYHGVYPGVDLVYYGNQRQLEYDFIVKPGADASRVRLAFSGATRVNIDPSGDLSLRTRDGAVQWHKPVVYQESDGIRKPVEGRYVKTGPDEVGFRVARYDASRPLVIDPSLLFSTYLGSTDYDFATDIAIDAAGNSYVTGDTYAADFPVLGPIQNYAGDRDAFVTKLNPTATGLVYSTFLGGSGLDVGRGIAVDSSGQAYVAGGTYSRDFPTTPGVVKTAKPTGDYDGFVTVLNAAGNGLVYSTLLGGSDDDEAWDIAVDAAHNAYLTGYTNSGDFPVTAGAAQTTYATRRDAFVTELNSSGTAILYSTFLGGYQSDAGYGIALDGSNNVYVCGGTTSGNFPATVGAFQTYEHGPSDGFVTKLTPTAGSGLTYSFYLGGDGFDEAYRIAVDTGGNAYVTGVTMSTNFPNTGAFQPNPGSNGVADAFVTKVNPTGTALVYSSYLGGSGADVGYDIAVDDMGAAYVTGYTESTDFPVVIGAIQSVLKGNRNAFVTKVAPSGATLVYSTYLGGSTSDTGHGIVVDANEDAYVAGWTFSSNFPVTPNVVGPALKGSGTSDAFVAKITNGTRITSFTPTSGNVGTAVRIFGAGFMNVTAVRFHGVNAIFTIVSPTEVDATVPSGATTGPISVVVPSGEVFSPTNFAVNVPVITTINPTSGHVGNMVTISGSGFSNTTSVAFNNVQANYVVNSDSSITAIVPAGATTGKIQVMTMQGQAQSSQTFTVLAPSITSFTPTTGPAGTSVSVTGSGFSGATQVTIGGTSAIYAVNSDTSLTVIVPAGSNSGMISVTTPAGTGTSTQTFTVTP